MRDPSKPDTQPDEYIPDAPNAHKQRAGTPNADEAAINPRDTSSMPRGEDDLKTWAHSPEYHDRTDMPEGGTAPAPPDSIQVFDDDEAH